SERPFRPPVAAAGVKSNGRTRVTPHADRSRIFLAEFIARREPGRSLDNYPVAVDLCYVTLGRPALDPRLQDLHPRTGRNGRKQSSLGHRIRSYVHSPPISRQASPTLPPPPAGPPPVPLSSLYPTMRS